ncbi:MAG: methionine--tRNA ligase [Candidatus Diapherotrites archaeon]|nr:methionine--tRNA ligase [Candidatus Diapherotrites archaeon]
MFVISEKVLVTAALPYANGLLHIAHVRSTYLPADVFSRFLKATGRDAIYICASDDHGTPIEVNAAKRGVSPEEHVAFFRKKQVRDFKDLGIEFDFFSRSSGKVNREFSDFFFNTLKEKGFIEEREVLHRFCPKCKRFLPDRFVKGTCPFCGAFDQYGDGCEECGKIYRPVDLLDPKCAQCGTVPVEKAGKHFFFKLSSFSGKLKSWLESNNALQSEVKNYALKWIEEGLEDWDITRDAPYCGFEIPGEKDKYYYVWFDAPIAYFSSVAQWAKEKGVEFDGFVSGDAKIYHFIGKDILYHHYLFWPAMLLGVEKFSLPFAIPTRGHGLLAGKKMSKSRGSFITVEDFLKEFPADYLRYYWSATTSYSMQDGSFFWGDFQRRVNDDLANTLGNFVNRTLVFVKNNFDSKVPEILKPRQLAGAEKEFDAAISRVAGDVFSAMDSGDLKKGLEVLMDFVRECNKYFNDSKPWQLVKEGKDSSASVSVSLCAKAVATVAVLAFPFVPVSSRDIWSQLGFSSELEKVKWGSLKSLSVGGLVIKNPKPVFKKIEDSVIKKVSRDLGGA